MSSTHVISQVEAPVEKGIDREKICPLLLRIFCSHGRHNSSSDYARGSVPSNELQIYTWMDCTLRELMSLIKDVNPDARRRGTEFSFAIVSPDRYSNRYNMRNIGTTISGQRSADDSVNLSQSKFEVGDFIDVTITLPALGAPGIGRGNGQMSASAGYGGSRREGRSGGGAPLRTSGSSSRYRD